MHISTVSRTFSAPHLVSVLTRSRVLACAKELGYRPNRAARALITGRTFNLGLIVADIANPFFPLLIKAAESQARLRDHHVFVADSNEDPAVEEDLVRALAKQVDGLLLCSPRMSNAMIAQLSREVPLVVVNRQIPGLASVVMDVTAGARAAVEHLIELGHRRIALLGGPRTSWTSREMRRSASAAVARSPQVHLEVLAPNPPTEAGGAALAERVLRSGVTAVLAHNDLMAIGLIGALHTSGVRVPQDVSVVGNDDIALSRLIHPKLTTVAAPTAAAGRAAVDMLLSHGDDRRTTAHLNLQTEFVIRDSTGPVRQSRSSAIPAGVREITSEAVTSYRRE